MQRLKISKDSISLAIKIINNGGIVIFPTETVYGIGCSIDSQEGRKRIYNVKGRSKDKPFQVLISNTKQLSELVSDISPETQKLIDKYWPGPLTLVFNKKDKNGTIGIRMPNHKVALEIIEACGPLYATSANISGENPPIEAKEVNIEADLLLDGGKCKLKEASTVIDVSGQKLKVLRQGIVII